MNCSTGYKNFIWITGALTSLLIVIIYSPAKAQGGHGPVFTLATPTLGKGELSYDMMLASVGQEPENAWMIRQNWHYGLTEDFQVNLSIPTSLQTISNASQGRTGTLMGTYGDIEASGLFRFYKTYPGIGKRFEASLLISGSFPTEDQRKGIHVGTSVNGALVTGYASRTIYFWVGGGYQHYFPQHRDRLGPIAYATAVLGYRPPVFQHDYPKPDWRIFVEGITERIADSRKNGQEITRTGGMKALLGPSVLGLYGKWGVSAGILFPVYNNFAGNSDIEDYRLSMILSYWF